MKLSSRQEVDEARHVSPLGPADIANRIIDPTFLVVRVIAARTVGTTEPDIQLLLVIILPGKIEAALTDVHHPPPVSSKRDCELGGFVRISAGCE
jgi:hypothetical protein